MANTIGIDFGTTKTMVSYLNPATRRPELVRLGRDRDSIPTTVHVDENGEFLFGEDADDQIGVDPEGYCRAFKLHLGENDPVLPRSGETAENLAARFLRHVKEECERSVFHDEVVTSATITVPVSFAPARKASLKRAAEAAGFSSVSFMPEPEAAGTAFLRDNPTDKFSRALVLDWGGGTLDIAIISRDDDGSIHADRRCIEGRDDIGGEEMDRGLFDNLKVMWKQAIGAELVSSEENEPQLLRESEKVKIGLSKKEIVPFRRAREKIDITRDKFRRIVEEFLQVSVELVQSVLSKNKSKGHPAPDAILLIGGTSQSPVVREAMEKNFPNLRVLSWHHSHEAVALGAMVVSNNVEIADSQNSQDRRNASVYPRGMAEASQRLPSEITSHDVELERVFNLAEKMIGDETGDLSSLGNREAKIIEKAALAGNPRAAGILAQIYYEGCEGYSKNLGASLNCAKFAAGFGNVDGLTLLSVFYLHLEDDSPVERDLFKALEYAEKAYTAGKGRKFSSFLLFLVLIQFDNPDTKRIEELGHAFLRELGDKAPDQFAPGLRDGIGTVCFILANIALEKNDVEKARELVQKGAAFGDKDCTDALSGLDNPQDGATGEGFTVTAEAIRLFAKLAVTAIRLRGNRLSQAQDNFIKGWCPSIYSSESWTRPFDATETTVDLARKTAESYGNDSAQLGYLLSVLRDFAACDGFIDNDVEFELMLISNVFGIDSGSSVATVNGASDEDPESWGVGTGAAVGAAIGTIIPGIGTALGAGIGAGVGWLKKKFK